MMTQFILSLLCCASDRLDWFIQTTCAEVRYYCSRKHHCSPTCRHKKLKALIEHNYFPRSCVGYGENTAVEKSQVLFLTLKLVIRDTQVRLKRTAVRHWVCGVSTIHLADGQKLFATRTSNGDTSSRATKVNLMVSLEDKPHCLENIYAYYTLCLIHHTDTEIFQSRPTWQTDGSTETLP